MTTCTFKSLSSTACKRSKRVIVDSFDYHKDKIRNNREQRMLRKILSDASLSDTKVTVITDSSKRLKGKLGLIALSVGRFKLDNKDYPALIIDYLFVDNKHRKKVHNHLGEKISRMLLIYAIHSAMDISKMAGLKYLILQPDGGKEHKSLIAFYKSMNFDYMTDKHEWMYLKLN